MSRTNLPTYRRQESVTGDRAFVALDGRRVFLGAYNSPESRASLDCLYVDRMVIRSNP